MHSAGVFRNSCLESARIPEVALTNSLGFHPDSFGLSFNKVSSQHILKFLFATHLGWLYLGAGSQNSMAPVRNTLVRT